MTTNDPHEFFKFCGKYHVAPDTSPEQMASDAACFLDSAEAIVNALIEGFVPAVSVEDQSMIFGVRHFVVMAKNLCQAVQTELQQERTSEATS